jgi:hypothetical protein
VLHEVRKFNTRYWGDVFCVKQSRIFLAFFSASDVGKNAARDDDDDDAVSDTESDALDRRRSLDDNNESDNNESVVGDCGGGEGEGEGEGEGSTRHGRASLATACDICDICETPSKLVRTNFRRFTMLLFDDVSSMESTIQSSGNSGVFVHCSSAEAVGDEKNTSANGKYE